MVVYQLFGLVLSCKLHVKQITSKLGQTMPSATIPSKRLIFIDALRAYAILMMLQGHFIDTMLADQFRNPEDWLYATWNFMRGMTAAIFFTASGIIFVFLLLKDGRPLRENIRVKKGIRRGFFLILLGYLLKWNLGALLSLQFYKSFISLDVLHSIGIALLLLIGGYALSKTLRFPLPIILTVLGIGLFSLYPKMLTTDWTALPVFFQNYVSRDHGSVFTPLPWVGFTLLGGVIGWHIHHNSNWYRTAWSGFPILIMGILLHLYSYELVESLYRFSHIDLFRGLLDHHWIFWRFGHVFIVLSLFIWISQLFYRFIPNLFLKVGTETLTIYSVHYVLLYGTWTGIGIKQLFGEKSFSPWEAAIGALLFISAFIYMVYKIEVIRAWLDREITQRIKYIYRFIRLKIRAYWRTLPKRT